MSFWGSTLTRKQEHGGAVIDRIPVEGFVLADIHSNEGVRLRDKWQSPDRPRRRVVPLTFVSACLKAKEIVQPLFVLDGEPVNMHIHNSVTPEKIRRKLKEHVHVCSLLSAFRHSLVYYASRRFMVEEQLQPRRRASFLSLMKEQTSCKCTKSSKIKMTHMSSLTHGLTTVSSLASIDTPISCARLVWVEFQGPSKVQCNIISNDSIYVLSRNEFTEREDKLLIAYIATKLPGQQSGRMGNKIYKDLCEAVILLFHHASTPAHAHAAD